MSKRFYFFLNHLVISLVFALLITSVVFLVWYPSPLAKAVGVTHIFLILVIIDVVIGPALGLLVYKEGKKSLKMDLSIIVIIQITALCYGIYSIAQGRPAWVVYNIDRFELIKNNEIIQGSSLHALPKYQKPSWLKPQFVATNPLKDIETRNNDLFTAVMQGVSTAQKPNRYVDIKKIEPLMQKYAQNLKLLNYYNNEKDVESYLYKYPQANGWLPLKASAVDMVVLMDKGEVVKIVDLRPWN